MEELDNPNVGVVDKPNKTNKLLIFILLVLAVTTLVLLSIHFYLQHNSSQNNTTISQTSASRASGQVPSPNQLIPHILNTTLPDATVGRQYSAEVIVGVYGSNLQITAKGSELPQGLTLLPCSTVYNSPEIAKVAAVNSLATCTIQGVPIKKGTYTAQVYFTTPGLSGEVYKDIPLTVSP